MFLVATLQSTQPNGCIQPLIGGTDLDIQGPQEEGACDCLVIRRRSKQPWLGAVQEIANQVGDRERANTSSQILLNYTT